MASLINVYFITVRVCLSYQSQVLNFSLTFINAESGHVKPYPD